VSAIDPAELRVEMLERWEQAAPGWGRHAEALGAFGMPVSSWMVERLELQPGHQVLELAAGPGDTGFLAAELVKPGGKLICSDGAEAMLEVARSRAEQLGIDNVEFRRLELEWIDLSTASVDAVLCRWGFMLCVDPAAAMAEARRVLRPGGRIALAVWDEPPLNPWATIPGRALVELGHAAPPDPRAPGMFALAPAAKLRSTLEAAGFVEVDVEQIELKRAHADADRCLAETLDLSRPFAEVFERLSEREREQVRERIAALTQPFETGDGSLRFPARSLVASASA
jgi:SAM-dependent methyltransferase